VIRCPACGRENPDGFQFCGFCTTPLTIGPAAEVRKVVTVVFCDLSDSTALGDRIDPEALRARMTAYYDEMRAILERHGGTVEKFIGDAVMGVFGMPVSHEDDALRAVRAAWEMRSAIDALGLRARIGVNTGEVVAGAGDSLVTGDAVNVGARLEQAAEPGEVLIGAATRSLVRDAVEAEAREIVAKGKPEPLAAHVLLSFDPEAEAISRRLDLPLVGRSRELAQLRDALARAVGERACHLFTVLGAAGVGKSRLVGDFLRDADATVVRGRCLDYGEGITFWPVVEALKQLGPDADNALAQIANGATSPNELFRTIRLTLEQAAADRPLIVLFDDIQWGEPTFLDLIDHVADLSRGASILLLCLARDELLELRPSWGGGKLNATTTHLEALSIAECEQLIDALGDGFSVETRRKVLDTAGGNPLFVEEMAALARDSGDVTVPSSIQALLQARLDRLGSDERTVIERGAVEGEIFHRGTVVELAPERTEVEQNLVGLVRKELIRPERATFENEDAYRFRHLLIRDAAYDALPKATRAELHERFATWLEHRGGLIELDEIVGHHLEQAARYRLELGQDAGDIPLRAGIHLRDAGRKAHAREDNHAAQNLLERSLALLPPGRERDSAALAVAELADQLGDFALYDERLAEALRSTDLRIQRRARLLQSFSNFLRTPSSATTDAESLLRELERQIEPDDHETRYWIAMNRYFIAWMGSRAKPALEALEHAIEHAQLAGDRRLERGAIPQVAGASFFGPIPRDRLAGLAGELDAKRDLIPSAGRSADALRINILYFEGKLEEAEQAVENVIAALLRDGSDFEAVAHGQIRTHIAMRQRRYDKAIEILEGSAAALRAFGADAYVSTHVAMLARAQYHAGNPERALAHAEESEAMSAREDVINFAISRGVRGRIEADRGAFDDGEVLARDALAYALQTDFPDARAAAYLDLAYVLATAGRSAEAAEAASSALAEYEAKGDVLGVAEAQHVLDSL
jgi:class 3 adenylate cyclase/predicted ATPase